MLQSTQIIRELNNSFFGGVRFRKILFPAIIKMIFLGSTPSLSFIPSPHPARQECSCYWTVSILSQLKCTKIIFETENPWKPVMSVDQDVYVSYYPSIEGDHQVRLISSSSAQC